VLERDLKERPANQVICDPDRVASLGTGAPTLRSEIGAETGQSREFRQG
jgi:hypothetical protein